MRWIAGAFAGLWISAWAAAPQVMGQKPSYVEGAPASFSNQDAITPRIWIPGLDDGWTPQGLALWGKYALVTSYQDKDPAGPRWRVFRVELAPGAAAGNRAGPADGPHRRGLRP